MSVSIASFLLFASCNFATAKTETQRDCNLQKDGNETKYEIPQIIDKKTPSEIIEHKGFTISFNKETLCANWVAWCLTREEVENKVVPRSNFFTADTTLPEQYQVQYYDYSGTGYSRGHMAPSADMRWDKQAMDDCFLMSNICPQHEDLNEGDWNSLEMACRRWAKKEGEIYIACGPIYDGSHKTIYIGDRHIALPDHFYKVIMVLTPGKERAIGFIFQNTTGVQFMKDNFETVDEIEKLTGIDFFSNVPKELQDKIEANADFSLWND